MSRRPKCSTPASTAALIVIEVADVGDRSQHLAALGLDEVDGLVEFGAIGHRVVVGGDIGADVDADDVGPFARQANRVAAALPARHPGDECDLAFQ